MKKFICVLLSVLVVCSTFVFTASAAKKTMTSDSDSQNIQDTYTLTLGTRQITVVGKGTLVWTSDLSGIGMNIVGWKKNTTTLDDVISVSVPSRYTGYLTLTVVEYPNGSPTVLSLSRTVGTRDGDTWYKEKTKTSYTHAVTSFATVEGTYSASDYYIGYPNVVNAHR